MLLEAKESFCDVMTTNGILSDQFDYVKWRSRVLEHAKAIELLQGVTATTTTQDQIEMLCLSVHQTQASMNKLADQSKQRARLRKRISSDKAKLKTHLDLYNNLHPDQPKVILSEVLDGKFPWEMTSPDSSNDTPVRVQRLVVESFQMTL